MIKMSIDDKVKDNKVKNQYFSYSMLKPNILNVLFAIGGTWMGNEIADIFVYDIESIQTAHRLSITVALGLSGYTIGSAVMDAYRYVKSKFYELNSQKEKSNSV